MNNSIYIHEATRQYVYPVKRNILEINFCTTNKDDIFISLVYWNRLKQKDIIQKSVELKRYAKDNNFAYYKCQIKDVESIKYLRYYFLVNSNDETIYINKYKTQLSAPEDGFFEYLYTNTNDVFDVPCWTRDAIFYQIFPERFYNGSKQNDPENIEDWTDKPTRENFFGGDLQGVIKKLDYLSDLGINAIYLNPIFASPSNHKYDTADYFAIDPSFGDDEVFRDLVDKCHKRGIKVILDGVFNHCGYYFEPFQHVIKLGEKSKYKNWFYINDYPITNEPPNYECVGYYKWMPKLNFACREVRDYFLDVGVYWIREFDIDGWRLDVSDELDFTFWSEFRRAIKNTKESAILIGETWKEAQDLLRGDQMDSVMNYVFYDAVVDFIAKNKIDEKEFNNRIQKMLSIYPSVVYPSLYNLIGSHDTARFKTLCDEQDLKLKLAAAFMMTFIGMPAIYYGDEIGMSGQNDPDCRRAMQWDTKNNDIHGLYKKLIEIRKSHFSLSRGSFACTVCHDNIYGYQREHEDERIYVIINNNKDEKAVKIPLFEDGDSEYISLLDNKVYESRRIEDGVKFFDFDVNDYKSFFEMKLPGYHFEIIIKRSKGK